MNAPQLLHASIETDGKEEEVEDAARAGAAAGTATLDLDAFLAGAFFGDAAAFLAIAAGVYGEKKGWEILAALTKPPN